MSEAIERPNKLVPSRAFSQGQVSMMTSMMGTWDMTVREGGRNKDKSSFKSRSIFLSSYKEIQLGGATPSSEPANLEISEFLNSNNVGRFVGNAT